MLKILEPCIAAPCKNGGICTSNSGIYTCQCTDDFQGSQCTGI